jgi:hypothetical protein
VSGQQVEVSTVQRAQKIPSQGEIQAAIANHRRSPDPCDSFESSKSGVPEIQARGNHRRRHLKVFLP